MGRASASGTAKWDGATSLRWECVHKLAVGREENGGIGQHLSHPLCKDGDMGRTSSANEQGSHLSPSLQMDVVRSLPDGQGPRMPTPSRVTTSIRPSRLCVMLDSLATSFSNFAFDPFQ